MSMRRNPTPKDLALKARAIRTFFDDFEDRVDFALSLYEQGREGEAFILTCSYIGGMASYLMWPEDRDKENFCRVLLEYGGELNLKLIHPRSLVRAMPGKGAAAKELAEKLEPLDPSVMSDMCPIEQFIEKLADMLDEEETALLRQHAYLGTLAAVAYTRLRNPCIHWGGGPDSITFDKTSFLGAPAPDLDFRTLARALRSVVRHAQSLSESTNTWFGHDLRRQKLM